MGAKASKANISGTPKKGEVAAEENVVVVQNGDAGKDGTNHIIEGAKEQMKDLMKDIANEAVDKVSDAAKEAMKPKEEQQNGDTTPTKEGEEGKKTKVQKKRSFRRFSFLRREGNKKKEAKEEKQKNGDVASPEIGVDELRIGDTKPSRLYLMRQNKKVIGRDMILANEKCLAASKEYRVLKAATVLFKSRLCRDFDRGVDTFI
ncbi:hypothetical protein Ocin01_06988, partial [Orchesella cincta]